MSLYSSGSKTEASRARPRGVPGPHPIPAAGHAGPAADTAAAAQAAARCALRGPQTIQTA